MTTQNNDDLFGSLFGNAEVGNEHTDYFSQADGDLRRGLAG